MPEITTALPLLALVAAFGYLLGSIPFGIVITRAMGLGDLRQIGSGNIGTTNVLRTGSKTAAALTLILDAAKGGVAALIARATLGEDAAHLAGLAAFLGHLFPVWLGFKGGKGVATYIGVLIGLVWPAALVFCGVWLAVAALTRYSSLSALVASLAAPFAAYAFQNATVGGIAAMMSVLLIVKHRPNIERLLRGEESRIGAKAESEDVTMAGEPEPPASR